MGSGNGLDELGQAGIVLLVVAVVVEHEELGWVREGFDAFCT